MTTLLIILALAVAAADFVLALDTSDLDENE